MHWQFLTKTSTLILLVTLVFGAWLWLFLIRSAWQETRLVFLAVGEGDALLITQGTYQILIDAGREGKTTLSHLGKFMPFYDRTLEVVVTTHPDADHIGGLPEILKHYTVEKIFSTGARSDTDTVELLEREISRRALGRELLGIAGTKIKFPQGGSWSVLFPLAPVPEQVTETNATSIVSRFDYGSTSFLLMGDLPDEEDYLPTVVPAEVLKVAHHGSNSSTSDVWLSLVQPKTAIISVGKNRYGHPAAEVIQRLTEREIEVIRTDEGGDIVYRCRDQWVGCRLMR